MNRIHCLFSIIVLSIGLFTVAACYGPATMPAVTPTSPAADAEILAQAFITAIESKQAGNYLDLFSEDAIYMDNGNPFSRKLGGEYMRNSRSFVIDFFKHEDYSEKFDSHFISADGRFIALSGNYTNTGKDGNPATVPIVIILEVKDGMVIREDVYYDSSPFY